MRVAIPVFAVLAFGTINALASVDSGLVALLPADSKVVAGIDVAKCRNSDFGQYLLSKSQANDPHFQDFMTQTGFDPRRDLETVLMSTSGDGGKGSGFAIVARGNFDAAKIRTLAMTHGAVAETYQGVNLIDRTDHGQTVAFGFPDAGVAVMGDQASIHQVIQNLSAASTLDVDLMNRIDQIGTANDAWVVSENGGAMLGHEIAAQSSGQLASQGKALQSIRAASAGVQFGSVVTVTFDAVTRSDQDAVSLTDVVRFMASLVQMQRQKDPRAGILAASIDKMQLQTNGNSVEITLTMPEKSLEQMADLGPVNKPLVQQRP